MSTFMLNEEEIRQAISTAEAVDAIEAAFAALATARSAYPASLTSHYHRYTRQRLRKANHT